MADTCLVTIHPESKISLIWCPSKQGVIGMDSSGHGGERSGKPTSEPRLDTKPWVYQQKYQETTEFFNQPLPSSQKELTFLLGTHKPGETYKSSCKLPRPEATMITRLQSGHCPLNGYLARFHTADTPDCDICHQQKDDNHLLMVCRKFVELRRTLFGTARKAEIAPNRAQLLTTLKMFKALSTFGRGTFPF